MTPLPEFLSADTGVKYASAVLCIALGIGGVFIFLVPDFIFNVAGVAVIGFGIWFLVGQVKHRRRMRALPPAVVTTTPQNPMPGERVVLSVEQEGDLGPVSIHLEVTCSEERSHRRGGRVEHDSVCLWESALGKFDQTARPGAPARVQAEFVVPEDQPPSSSTVRWLVDVRVERNGEFFARTYALTVAPLAVPAAG